MRKYISIFLVFICLYTPAEATHLVGGELSYECISGDAYVVRLKLYRDCLNSTVDFDSPAEIVVYNPNNAIIQTIGMQLPGNIGLEDFDPCIINPPNVCIEAAVYQTVINIPQNVVGDYIIAYQVCCRNGSIANIMDPLATGNTYWSTIPSNTLVSCNSSPSFDNLPPTAVCVFEPLYVDLSATDSDGDSLVYTLCTPYDDAGGGPPFLDISWLGPYNVNNQIGGSPALSIDPVTGALTGFPNLTGQFLVGICVEEYRDGLYLGSTFRDFQFNVTSCAPYDALDFSFDQSTYTACEGDTICPTLNINIDSTDIAYTINSDGPVTINPSTFTSDSISVSGMSNTTIGAGTLVSVCLDLAIGNQFQISVILYCPDGTSIFLFAPNQAAGIDMAQTCFTGTATTPISDGIPPYTGEFAPVNLTPFTDLIGCPTNGDWSISINNAAGSTTGTLNGWSLTFMTQNEVESIEWSDSTIIGDPLNPCIVNSSGNYSVTITDLLGCSVAESYNVILNPSGDPSWTLPPSPCLYELPIALSADYDLSGVWSGTGVTDNGDGTASFFPTMAGSYNVSYCTTLGPCTDCEQYTIDTQAEELSDFILDQGYCMQDPNIPIPTLLGTSVAGGNFSSNPVIPIDPSTGELLGIDALPVGTILEVIYTSPGTAGCISSSSQFIEIYDLPDASFDPLAPTICPSDFNIISLNPSTAGGTFTGDGVNGSSFDPSSLAAGIESVDISYSLSLNGCTSTTTQTINIGNQEIADFNISNNDICANDGLFPITILGPGSTLGGIWSISSGSINPSTGQIDLTSILDDLNYTVSYQTTGICADTVSADFIINSSPDIAVVSSTNASCNQSNGGSNMTVSSSSGLYSAVWYDIYNNPVSYSENLTGVIAGSYTLIVTDDVSACSANYTVTIADDGAPSIAQDLIVDPSCGLDNGSISIIASGGQAPLEYSWSQDATLNSPSATGLIAGTYTVYVSDANYCEVYIEITIADTGTPSIDPSNALIIDANCSMATDGAISNVTISGGDGNYAYEWTDITGAVLGSAIDISDLWIGDFMLTVTDGAGCMDSMNFNILDANNAPLVLSTDISAAICGDDVGALSNVTFSNGAANVVMYWTDATGTIVSGTSDSEDLSDLAAGDYTVWLVDDAGCEGQMTFTVPSTDALLVDDGVISDASCGQDDGTITGLVVSGGDGSFSYQWSDGAGIIASSLDITGLYSGAYTLTVTDGSGCSETFSYSISDTNGPSLSGVIAAGTACGDDSGMLTGAIVSGGTGPYIYEWSDMDGIIIGNLSNIDGLSAGTYTLSITDINGCETSDTYTINDQPGPALSLGSITDENCGQSDAAISSVLVSGGTGSMDYAWVNDNDPSNVISTSADLTGVEAGNYTLTVTDTNSCEETISFTIADVGYVSLSSSTIIESTCGMSNGSINGAIASGGDGSFSYVWTDIAGLNIPLAPNNPDFDNIEAGTYTLTVTDGNGCTATETVVVNDIPAAIIGTGTILDANCGYADGSITAVDINGLGPYTYEWSDASGIIGYGPDLTSAEAGTYSLTVMDINGCSSLQSFTIANIGSTLDPTFSFNDNTYCVSDPNPLPDFVASPGGSFTSDPGLDISTTDGSIDLSNSIPGSYTISYSTAPPCPAISTFDVTLTDIESVSFSYGSTSYCSDELPIVTSASLANAVFFSSDFTVDPLTGEIDLSLVSPPFLGTVFSSTNSACSDTTQISISIMADDISDFSYSALAFCLLDNDPLPNFMGTSGSFSASGGLIIDPITGLIDLSSAGTGGSFDITFSSNGTCPTLSTQTITISSFLDASFTLTENVYCSADGFSAIPINILTSGGEFSVDNGFSVDSSTGIIDFSSISEDINLSLTYTTSGNCGDSFTEQITVISSPSADFLLDENICVESSTSVAVLDNIEDAFPTSDYLWDFADAIVISGSGSGPYEISYSDPGSYTVDLQIDNAGCLSSSTTYNIEVSSLEVAAQEFVSIGLGSSVDLGELLTILSTNSYLEYNWSPSNGLSCSNCANPVASPSTTTTYQLTLIDPDSGCTQIATITVEVIESEIFIPNAFSPNEDGLNDVFHIYGGEYSDVLIRVFNRWGELMFETSDSSIGWDGTYRNENQNPGVYIYTIYYRSLDQQEKFLKGNVTLLR